MHFVFRLRSRKSPRQRSSGLNSKFRRHVRQSISSLQFDSVSPAICRPCASTSLGSRFSHPVAEGSVSCTILCLAWVLALALLFGLRSPQFIPQHFAQEVIRKSRRRLVAARNLHCAAGCGTNFQDTGCWREGQGIGWWAGGISAACCGSLAGGAHSCVEATSAMELVCATKPLCTGSAIEFKGKSWVFLP